VDKGVLTAVLSEVIRRLWGMDRHPGDDGDGEREPLVPAPDCARVAHRADLDHDHDQPWPRGPTDAENLHPRCRRHHELKTRGLITTSLQPDGTVHTRMLTGLTVTTRPEPLPGHAPGEGCRPSR
jgi:hypothetical protein